MSQPIVIGPDWIKTQATRMGQIKESLSEGKLNNLADQYHGIVGSSEVADKLSDVVSNWSQQRSTITTNLGSLQEYANAVADAHQQLDLQVSSAFGGGA